MPQYVLLMKLTEKGAAAIADAPRRIDEAIARWEQLGGTMTVFCATMGEYDYVAVGEALTDERAAAFALALSQQGNVKTTTLRGFTRQDLGVMLEGVPADNEDDGRPSVRRDEDEGRPSRRRDEDDGRPSRRRDEDDGRPSVRRDEDDGRPSVRREEPDEEPRPAVKRPEEPDAPPQEPSE